MKNKKTSTLRLSDGRLLEYAQYGDPTGAPVFYLHGFLASCHQAALAERYAHAYNFRIIAPNRPGVGKSTPHTFNAMVEYADDLQELADALKIETFSVVGASGGGAFALACAYALPERIKLAGIAGGLGPMSQAETLGTMHWFRRSFLSSVHHYPRTAGVVMKFSFICCKTFPRLFYHYLTWASAAFESDAKKQAKLQEVLWLDFKDILLQEHGARGLVDEIELYFRWGYNPKNFPDTPVIFWHGDDDTIAPWPGIQRVAEHIPSARIILLPGGHLTFLQNAEGIITTLRREWNATTAQRQEQTFFRRIAQYLHVHALMRPAFATH